MRIIATCIYYDLGVEYLAFVSSRSFKTREKYTNWDNLVCLSLHIFWGQSHLCLFFGELKTLEITFKIYWHLVNLCIYIEGIQCQNVSSRWSNCTSFLRKTVCNDAYLFFNSSHSKPGHLYLLESIQCQNVYPHWLLEKHGSR